MAYTRQWAWRVGGRGECALSLLIKGSVTLKIMNNAPWRSQGTRRKESPTPVSWISGKDELTPRCVGIRTKAQVILRTGQNSKNSLNGNSTRFLLWVESYIGICRLGCEQIREGKKQ